MTSNRTVKIYKDVFGNEPFTLWIQSIKDKAVKARIQQRIRRIELGNFGDHKLLSQGVWELKLDFGPGYRVYYGEDNHKIVILICGGDKKLQQNDIEKAKQYWREYKKDSL
jgi:putative addiction module killer protein